jgi:hypothetical protein
MYFTTPLDKMYELQIQPKVDVNMFIMAQQSKSKLERGKTHQWQCVCYCFINLKT